LFVTRWVPKDEARKMLGVPSVLLVLWGLRDFTVDELIKILSAGLSVASLLDLIASRLLSADQDLLPSNSRWIM
jgi:hypothetical protein